MSTKLINMLAFLLLQILPTDSKFIPAMYQWLEPMRISLSLYREILEPRKKLLILALSNV